MKKNPKENSELAELIHRLGNENKPIWQRTAELLARSRRNRVEVNVSKLEKHATDHRTLLVPGKVLGSGVVHKKMHVAAFSFSEGARTLIHAAGGKTMSIPELRESNAEGKDVLLIV